MEIEEIRQKKRILLNIINIALRDFTIETGLKIRDVKLYNAGSYHRDMPFEVWAKSYEVEIIIPL